MMLAIVGMFPATFSETTSNIVLSYRRVHLNSHIAIFASSLALSSMPAIGQEMAKGPAAAAVENWYRTDPKIKCVGPTTGVAGQCGPGHSETLTADYSPDGRYALAVATWVTDPTGNAAAGAIALFEKIGVTWRKIRDVDAGRLPEDRTGRWTSGSVTFDVAVMRPSDARWPTGRKSMTVPLAGTNMHKPTPTPVRAKVSPGDLFDHNGSRMIVDRESGTITYDRPKGSLRPSITSGTILYRGTITMHGEIAGTAFAFKAGCAPAPYSVRGRVEYRKITLRGAGPVRQGCQVVGYSETSPNATLRFNWIVVPEEDFGDDT